jgi:hypothetical protein
MKVWLAIQLLHTKEELMDGVNNWLHNLVAPFFDEELQKPKSQYDNCLNVMATMRRSNAVMYVTVPYNKVMQLCM